MKKDFSLPSFYYVGIVLHNIHRYLWINTCRLPVCTGADPGILERVGGGGEFQGTRKGRSGGILKLTSNKQTGGCIFHQKHS